ncbi:MAG: hypothetical protein ACFCU5_10595 [Pleurocapsa sp.]
MNKRLYCRTFKLTWRYCLIFLITLIAVLFGGTVSAANIPITSCLQLVADGIEQQVSIDPLSTPQMFVQQKAIYRKDLEIGLRTDGVVVWRKLNK